MSLLDVRNLNLGFNFERCFVPVVCDVSFSLNKGRTLAIVGESGSGKSLTAMSILKLLPKNAKITGGEIIFNGKNILELSEAQMHTIRGRKIALIPQDPMCSLNPLYTIGNQLMEVIYLHSGLKGEAARKAAVDALDKVRIPDAKNRLSAYAHELSGGMKQRVIIAMALATNAEIIIADEPTTALDVTVQAQIMKLLNEIKVNYGTSIILITHDLGLVAENSETTAVMYGGKIVEFCDTAKIFEHPAHPYTTALLKALPDINKNKLEIIQGQPPSIFENISGCRFHPRCKSKIEICESKLPELKCHGVNACVACFNPN